MEEKTLHANARAVLEVLRETDTHPTALELYHKVRLLRPHIGLATVYRILHQLTEQKLICEIGRDAECRYDANTSRHDHAICTECGALLDVPVEVQIASESLRRAAQSAGLELSSHEVRMYGRCQACQQRDAQSVGDNYMRK
jgi:Fur family peroxide stress response transcriptional regulator